MRKIHALSGKPLFYFYYLTSRSGGLKTPVWKKQASFRRTLSRDENVSASERRLYFLAGYFQYPLREVSYKEKTMSETAKLSRRTLLKGMGVTMALPLLEAMQPLAAAADSAKSPVRFAMLYMPNGVNPAAWTPQGTGGADFTLSPTLSPLEKVKSDVLVLTELMNKNSIEGDGHYAKVAPLLVGTAITKTTGSNLRCGGISLDQYIAQQVGHNTPLPSLELSIEQPTTYVDTNVGYTSLYGSHISWSTPTTPVTREVNPQLAFDRLFRSNAKQGSGLNPADRSILDAVMADAKRLEKRLGAADKHKLNEYYDAVRSVEKRIAFDATKRKEQYLDSPRVRAEIEKLGGRIKDYYQDPAKLSQERSIDHTEQVRIMMEIIALAFWTDSTRVSTFMFGNEVTGRNFSFLPGVRGGHHEISHHENHKDKLEQYQKINQWHVAQYAYLLERLKSLPEGNSNLLDNSMILFAGGMKDGNAHSPYNLPVILAGKGGGTLRTGRHLISPEKTPLCNLYTAILDKLGHPVERFGDSTKPLAI